MKRNYKNYTDQDIVLNSAKSTSLSQLLKSLNLKMAGGNFNNMRRNLQRLNVNTDHWTGQAWNKNQRLKDWSKYSLTSSIKPHLIKSRGHKCEVCNNKEWMNNPIPLEVHHIDGNRINNELSNLQLLCGNCHALTNNWRNKKPKN